MQDSASAITLTQAYDAIMTLIRINRPLMMWGPPGIGKSEIVHGLQREPSLGRVKVVDVRLALWDPTDLKGMPFYDPESKTMRWAEPSELPSVFDGENYDTIILFLDELPGATPMVQSAAYQLVLDRKVGTYTLPDNVRIIAAGNRESDKGVTFKMPSPLANRFVHVEVKVDYDSWLNWAAANQVHADVIGYITANKRDLFEFDVKSASRAWPSPRTWTYASDILYDKSSVATTNILINGTVGEGIALKFAAHRENNVLLPEAADILDGKITELGDVDSISAKFSLTVNLCYELKARNDDADMDRDEWFKMADNFFKFMMKNFEPEMNVMGAQFALNTYKLPFNPSKITSFVDFHKRYGKFIMAATAA